MAQPSIANHPSSSVGCTGVHLSPPKGSLSVDPERSTQALAFPESAQTSAYLKPNAKWLSNSFGNSHVPQTLSAIDNTDLPFICMDCEQRFRTPGQVREHERRKHVRRFVCLICSRDFNLRADLMRHEKTVHNTSVVEAVNMRGSGTMRCPILGCKNADKVWARKDNLERHAKRCRKASERLMT